MQKEYRITNHPYFWYFLGTTVTLTVGILLNKAYDRGVSDSINMAASVAKRTRYF